jgi:hypothetical protein
MGTMSSTADKIRGHLRDARALTDIDGYMYVRELFPVGIGVSLSIQASAGHYCQPKETLKDDDATLYTHVEVYVGDTPLESLIDNDGCGVAGCVLIEDLADAIDKVYGS